MSQVILEINHLKKSFGANQVLKDISLTVHKGEVISIIGSSGSGKSTFLRSINLLEEKGPQAVADWMAAQKRVLLTDTTMRDGHQSLLATRMRSYDMVKAAPAYAANLP